jgi:hypothetical protein
MKSFIAVTGGLGKTSSIFVNTNKYAGAHTSPTNTFFHGNL